MIPRQASPQRARRYFTTGLTKHAPRGDQVPALIWLWLAIVGLVMLREHRLLQVGEYVTLAIAGGIIVGIGNFAPHLVTLFLLALLVAGIFGAAPQVSAFLDEVNGRVSQLAPGVAARGGGALPGRVS